MLNFWARLKNGKSTKLSCTILRLLEKMSVSNYYTSPWFSKIKELLNNNGMSHLIFAKDVDPKLFKYYFDLRSSDINKQMWRTEIENSSVCTTYRTF